MSDTNLVTIQLNGKKQDFLLSKKDFKTGSKGYYAQGKMQIEENMDFYTVRIPILKKVESWGL